MTSQSGGRSSQSVLELAAFGDARPRWPLPPAATPAQLWLRAVAAGGHGWYAGAHTDLATLRREQPAWSLGYSTTASLLRQLGWHVCARHWDGIALRLAGANAHARGDALVGLAADALGVGRFGVSATLLEAAARLTGGPARHPVRVAWVRAELAMATGDGAVAVQHARRGVALASGLDSTRHRLKSDVVLAAALCSAGRISDARPVAESALMATGRHGLLPLQWAVASLLLGIGSTTPEVVAVRDAAAHLIARRGGRFAG